MHASLRKLEARVQQAESKDAGAASKSLGGNSSGSVRILISGGISCECHRAGIFWISVGPRAH